MANQDLPPENNKYHQQRSSDESFGSIPTMVECREFSEQLRELLEPYLDLSEEKIENFNGLEMSLEAAQELIVNRPAEVDSDFVQSVLQDLIVSFVDQDKLDFAAELVSGLPEADKLIGSELYRAAVSYALDGRIKYGKLPELTVITEALYPDYLKSDNFYNSVEYALSEALTQRDYFRLGEISDLFSECVESVGGMEQLRIKLIIAGREEAWQALQDDFNTPENEVLIDFFWLEERLNDPSFQSKLVDLVAEHLKTKNFSAIFELTDRFALEADSIAILAESAQLAVKREKAAIAAGYYDNFSRSELQSQKLVPLNLIVELFQLSRHLKEPIEVSKAA